MPPDKEDALPVYEVRVTEPAEAEIDTAYLNRMQFGLQSAERWYAGLAQALESLATFPKRFPFAPEHNFPDGVRQMIYGKGSGTYRILYRVIEAQGEEAGIVRILHVRHGSRQPPGEDEV